MNNKPDRVFNERPIFNNPILQLNVSYYVSRWQRDYNASSIVIYHGPRKTSYPEVDSILPEPEKYDFADINKGLAWNASQALWLCINDLALKRLYSVDGFSFAGHYAVACVGHRIVILDGFASTDSPFWRYIKENAKGFFYVNILDYMVKEEN